MSVLSRLPLLLCLLTPVAGYSFSYQDMNSCGVPVCSISETLKDLRAMNGDQRGMYAINLKNQYKDSKDVKVLENLYELSIELKKLFGEMNDEDWVKRSASDLLNQMVFNLAKYSAVNAEAMIQYYHLFVNQTYRYNLIAHWQAEVSKIEDIDVLEQLVLFAEGARDHSIAIYDEDWVSRAATSLISEITIKLTHLDPSHEGLYDVTTSSSSSALAFDRVAVLDSSSERNLVVSFINTRLNVIVYSYNHAEMSGNTISGTYLSNGDAASHFTFTYDRSSGSISGTVESLKHGMVEFSGKQKYTTRSVFAGNPPYAVSEDDIIGTMKGEMAGVKGQLTIRSFRKDVYSATFMSESGSVIMNFQGKFFSKRGVLSLTSSDKIKLNLSIRQAAGGTAWRGSTFNTLTGTVASAMFSTLN